MDIRRIINKPQEMITQRDIADLIAFIKENLSPTPWTPGYILKINQPGDLEFCAKSPELTLKLCEYILHLFSIIDTLQVE